MTTTVPIAALVAALALVSACSAEPPGTELIVPEAVQVADLPVAGGRSAGQPSPSGDATAGDPASAAVPPRAPAAVTAERPQAAGAEQPSVPERAPSDTPPRTVIDVDRLLGAAATGAMPRAATHLDASGRPVGLRLSGVRAGSVGHRLGLRDGDIVHRVAGARVTSEPEAFAAVAALEAPADFDVELTRRGSPMVLLYRLE